MPTGTRRRRTQILPPEIIHLIASIVVGDYLDVVIAGHLALPRTVEPSTTASDSTALDSLIDLHASAFDIVSSPFFEPYNAVLPLLQTSTQMRAITLHVLSEALGIAVVKEGIQQYVPPD